MSWYFSNHHSKERKNRAQNRSDCSLAEDRFVLVTSRLILKELYAVLQYPRIVRRFSPTKEQIDAFMGMIIEYAVIVEGRYRIDGVTADPKDDMFIACAMEANAHYIVSRDPHLRNVKHYRGIQIIDVATFADKVKAIS